MLFMKVMFSKVDGMVLNHGKPVPNVVVTRYFNFGWTDTERTVSTKTGADGTFHFPIARRFSVFTSIIPHEPCVS